MKKSKVLVGSISYAIKGKRILAKEGITANLIKESDHTAGCSYGLSFEERDEYRVYPILSAAGIPIKQKEEDS